MFCQKLDFRRKTLHVLHNGPKQMVNRRRAARDHIFQDKISKFDTGPFQGKHWKASGSKTAVDLQRPRLRSVLFADGACDLNGRIASGQC
jgi:hypothetical protein